MKKLKVLFGLAVLSVAMLFSGCDMLSGLLNKEDTTEKTATVTLNGFTE